MSNSRSKKREKLPSHVKMVLFCTSYIPLFSIIMMKQLFENSEYLHFSGFTSDALNVFISNFAVTTILAFLCTYGLIGIIAFVINMRNASKVSGHQYTIKHVQNKNTESIGYIATYLVPFMFQGFSSAFEIYSFFLLLTVMYIIYTHSTLIVVNPILNLKYSLYDIQFIDEKSGRELEGTFIIDSHYAQAGDLIIAKDLGSNLFYAIIDGEENE
jgi:hypothetical protein